MARISNQMHRRNALPGRVIAAGAFVTALVVLSGCTSASPAGGPAGRVTHPAVIGSSGTSTAASSQPPAYAKPVVSVTPREDAQNVNPVSPVDVKVAHGTLTSVTMVNPEGKHVTGALASDGTSWHTTEVLGYDKTYRIISKVRDPEGATVVKHSKFTTLSPNNQTLPYFDTVYGSSLQRGATYGVGMVAVVNFDEPIPDKKAAEQALQVTTTPHVDGAWYWTDSHTAHWRPEHFYAPGTKVTISAKVYGKDLGSGLFGQSDESTWFKIGPKHYSVANAKTHRVKVYFDNKLVRNMPTSMGQGGIVHGTNGPIYLWTMPGVYTVINHENPAIMSSDSYGLPSTSQYGYPPEKVYWSTKISTDGIYLHELDTTIWAQGHQNVSHGCLNLDKANAKWFYIHSRIGDVVKVVHSGGPKIQVWQGGDWSVPWSTWVKGGDI